MTHLPSLGSSSALLLAAFLSGCGGSGSTPGLSGLAPLVFRSRLVVPAELRGAHGVAAADLTGNGRLDLAVISANAERFETRIASGVLTWSRRAGAGFDLGGAPGSVAIGDLDGDGDADVVVTVPSESRASVFRNDGRGSLTADPRHLAVGAASRALYVADIDGDRMSEVIVAGGAELRVFETRGTALVETWRLDASATSELAAVASADFDGDGRIDLAACDEANDEVVVWYRTASGFDAKSRQLLGTRGRAPVALDAADANGDGWTDLIVANRVSSSVSAFFADGRGNFDQPVVLRVGAQPVGLRVADVYGDGGPHLVLAFPEAAAIGVVRATGRGGFGGERRFTTGGATTGFALADVDGDGSVDVVAPDAASDTISILRGGGARGPIAAEGFAPDLVPGAVAAADFDADGRGDIVAADGKDTVVVLPGAAMDRPWSVGGLVQPNALGTGDVNGDGRLDVVVAVRAGIRWLAWRPAGDGFDVVPARAVAPIAVGDAPRTGVVTDLDGDRVADVVVAVDGGGLVVLRGTTGGPVVASHFAATPVEHVVTGDFDGDTRPDVATSDARGVVTVMFGNGRHGFARRREAAVGRSISAVAVTDLEHDGRDELLVVHADSATLDVVRAGDGGGVAVEAVRLAATGATLAAGDLDRDGSVDLVIGHAGGPEFEVLRGDGRGGFRAGPRLPGLGATRSLVLTDVDADGRLDICAGSGLWTGVTVLRSRAQP